MTDSRPPRTSNSAPAVSPSFLTGLVTQAGEPIGYTVRTSARAKRVTLRVYPDEGLVVTRPRGVSRRRLERLLLERREWIRSALDAITARTPVPYRDWPPRRLDLDALGHRVSIDYAAVSSRAAFRWFGDERLVLDASREDRREVVGAVLAALRARAAEPLGGRLARLGAIHGLSYERVSIRAQRTRWGSCSSRGTISLNCKLLFLPPVLVDYVLLHELAHTRHLDHSPAYWALLESLVAGARALDRRLSAEARRVPPWLA